jgi:tetratricopeptide (TPR) repeat protein
MTGVSKLLLGVVSLVVAQAATPLAMALPKPSNARAEARANAKAEVAKAQVEFQLGRYDRALEGYTSAYELYPVPGLLFNLGQCYRNLKNYERAVFFFEAYLRESPKLGQDQRALTEGLIAESKAGLELERERDRKREQAEAQKTAAAAAARAELPRSDPTPARPALVLSDDRDQLRDQLRDRSQAPSRPHRSIARRWWFWTAIGLSVAGGVAAYYFTGDPRRVAPPSSVGTLDGR